MKKNYLILIFLLIILIQTFFYAGEFGIVNAEDNIDTGLSVLNSEIVYTVEPGSDLLLEVTGVTINEEYKDSLTYKWFQYDWDWDSENRTWDRDNENELEDVNGKSYMVNNIQKNCSYLVEITDCMGNNEYVDFYIYIDTGLSISDSSNKSYTVEPGSDQLLEVTGVTINEEYKDSLTYKWIQYDWDNENRAWDWNNRKELEDVNGTSYTVNNIRKNCKYEVVISDCMGNYKYVYFYIYIDTGLSVPDSYSYAVEYTVKSGSNQLLEIVGITIKDEYKDSLTYKWKQYDWDIENRTWDWANGKELENVNGTSYTANNIQKKSLYEVYITDCMGNYKSIGFSINIDTGLSVLEPEREYTVKLGSNQLLDVTGVTINEEYKDTLIYRWTQYVWDYESKNWDWDNGKELENVNGTSYTVSNIQRNAVYQVYVTDQLGNTVYVNYYINIDTGLSVSDSSRNYTVEPGNNQVLEVTGVTINEEYKDSLTYKWFQYDWDNENGTWNNRKELEGINGTSYTVNNIQKNCYYRVKITDCMGNYEDIDFYINIDTGLSVLDSDISYIVEPGSDKVLEIKGLNINEEYKDSLTYKWYRWDRYNDGWSSDGKELDGVYENTYTVNNILENCHYEVRIIDCMGNYESIYFYINIDTGLSVFDSYKSYTVEPGSNKVLEVTGVTINEEYKDSLTYQWTQYDWDNENKTWDWANRKELKDVNGTSYTVNDIQEKCHYEVMITDCMGNREWVNFYIYLDSGLEAKAKISSIAVKNGGSATMEVIASAKDDVDINYSWYREIYNEEDGELTSKEIEDSNDNKCTVDGIEEWRDYYCDVRTSYGDVERIYFYVYPSDVPLNMALIDEGTQFLSGDSIELHVESFADDEYGELKTQWYYNDEKIEGQFENNIYFVNAKKEGTYIFRAWYENEIGEIISEFSGNYYVMDINNALEMPDDNIYSLEDHEQKLYKIDGSIFGSEDIYLLASCVDHNGYDVYITLYDSELNIIESDINLFSSEGATTNHNIYFSFNNGETYYMQLENLDYDGNEEFKLEFVPASEIYECSHPENSRSLVHVQEATCDEEGYTGDIVCNDCGRIISYGDYIPALEHKLINETIQKPATCVEDGIMSHECEICGETINVTIPATGKHSYDAGVVTKNATTTEKGEKKYTCAVCGATYIEEIPMLDQSDSNSDSVSSDDKEKTKETNDQTNDNKNQNAGNKTNTVDQKISDDEKNEEPSNIISVGDTITYKSIKYRVLAEGKVEYVSSNNKKIKSVVIPATIIDDNGNKYKVTEIANNAFKNYKKLTKITIGKNVTKIGKNAFNGCKKLSKITIKSSLLKSVGKNAIKGINKKATIKVPKKKLTKYKKLFKKSTGYKKTMKIK